MSNHILTVTPEGELHYTRGDAAVEVILEASPALANADMRMDRITEIKLSPENRRFYICWLRGPYAGEVHSHTLDSRIRPEVRNAIPYTMYFNSYEAAVKHEIAVVAAMRKQGVTF